MTIHYQDHGVTLYHGDCRDEHGEPILPPLPPKTPWGHA